MDSVTTGVGEGGLGVVTAGKKVVAIGVKRLFTGAEVVVGVVRDERQAHVPLEEKHKKIIGDAVVGVLAGKTVER